MPLSFLDLLRTGEMPPLTFGRARSEVLESLGPPTDWWSLSEPYPGIRPPQSSKRSVHVSDYIAYGDLTACFDSDGRLNCIFIHFCDHVYPEGAIFFPDSETSIYDVGILMRRHKIPFTDSSPESDLSELTTTSGVVITMLGRDCGHLWTCTSERLPSRIHPT